MAGGFWQIYVFFALSFLNRFFKIRNTHKPYQWNFWIPMIVSKNEIDDRSSIHDLILCASCVLFRQLTLPYFEKKETAKCVANYTSATELISSKSTRQFIGHFQPPEKPKKMHQESDLFGNMQEHATIYFLYQQTTQMSLHFDKFDEKDKFYLFFTT